MFNVFFDKIKNGLFYSFIVLVFIWYILPFYINFKRFYFGVSPIKVMYPFPMDLLFIYYILYFLLFFFMLYKFFKLYYLKNNKEHIYIKRIDDFFQIPWIFLENHVWQKFSFFFNFFCKIVNCFEQVTFTLFSKKFYKIHVFFYFTLFFMLFVQIICLCVLYLEVLYFKQIYYIYYFLSLLLLNILLLFIWNRLISTCQYYINYSFSNYYKQIEQITYEKRPSDYIIEFYPYPYVESKFVGSSFFLLYCYINDVGSYVCIFYEYVIDVKNPDKFFSKEVNLFKLNFEKKYNIVVDNDYDYILLKEHLFLTNCLHLNSYLPLLHDFKYYKNKIIKYVFVISVVRIGLLLLLLNIVVFLNS